MNLNLRDIFTLTQIPDLVPEIINLQTSRSATLPLCQEAWSSLQHFSTDFKLQDQIKRLACNVSQFIKNNRNSVLSGTTIVAVGLLFIGCCIKYIEAGSKDSITEQYKDYNIHFDRDCDNYGPLFFKCKDGKRVIIDYSSTACAGHLRAFLHSKYSYPLSMQIIFGGRVLKDEEVLSQYKSKGSTLKMDLLKI